MCLEGGGLELYILNREEKVQWLNRYKQSYFKVKDIESQILSEGDISALILSDIKSDNRYSLDDLLVRHEEYREEYEIALSECREIRREIVDAMGSIDNLNAYRVIRLRYIGLLNWETIADRMHYSKQSIFRFHKAGLDGMRVNESK